MKRRNMPYCVSCGKNVEYSLFSRIVEITIRGTTFKYSEVFACCKECGEEIYIPEINDSNVTAREEAYRKTARLITISELRRLLKKYNIGAGPLAKLLDFGEVTINRYLLGQLPSREHSEKLLNIMYNRKEMEFLLEQGKNSITASAYSKCRKALDSLDEVYENKKINLVAKYLLIKAVDITQLSLQKLLYYAQAFFRALYNEELFSDDCQAWVLGPVFPEIYYKYVSFGYDPISNPLEESEAELMGLTNKEVIFLDAILSSFGQYSGKVLSQMTHMEKPWLETRGTLHPEDRSVAIIKRSVIADYFSDVVKNYGIINPCDIIKYSNDMCSKVFIN